MIPHAILCTLRSHTLSTRIHTHTSSIQMPLLHTVLLNSRTWLVRRSWPFCLFHGFTFSLIINSLQLHFCVLSFSLWHFLLLFFLFYLISSISFHCILHLSVSFPSFFFLFLLYHFFCFDFFTLLFSCSFCVRHSHSVLQYLIPSFLLFSCIYYNIYFSLAFLLLSCIFLYF